MAMPRGPRAPSGLSGLLDAFENRTVTSTLSRCMCAASVRARASAVGRNTPRQRVPLACAARAAG